MNAYSSQLLVFYKSSLDNRDFLLVKAGKARWAPDSARSSSILSPLPAMNLAPCNSSHHQSPCSLFLFAVFCRHLAASLHSLLPACVSTTFVEITSSKPFPCFAVPFLYSCQATNGCGLYRSQRRTILFPRVSTTRPLFSAFLERKHPRNVVWMKGTSGWFT